MFNRITDIGLIYCFVMAKRNQWAMIDIHDQIDLNPAQQAMFEAFPYSGHSLALEAKESLTATLASMEKQYRKMRGSDVPYDQRSRLALDITLAKSSVDMVDEFLGYIDSAVDSGHA